MTHEGRSPTVGTIIVAVVVVALIRLPMVVTTGLGTVGVGLVGDFDIGVRRAIGIAVVAWPLWAMLLVAGERILIARRDRVTTRLDIVALQCLATAASLLASSALLAGGLAYGLVVAAIMCVVEVLGLTGGRPFSTDWRAPTTCSLERRRDDAQRDDGPS